MNSMLLRGEGVIDRPAGVDGAHEVLVTTARSSFEPEGFAHAS